MTKKTKILLAIALSAFAISLTGVLWGLFLPVGAIFFGLFMIFNVLGNETALFDKECQLRMLLAEKNSAVPVSQEIHDVRALRTAASH